MSELQVAPPQAELTPKVKAIVEEFERKLSELRDSSKKQLESLRKADNVTLQSALVESLVEMYQKAGHYNICIEFIKRKEVLGIEETPIVEEKT